MANLLSFLADPEYWKSVRETAPSSLGSLAQGVATATAGAPVDIANMVLKPFGLGSEKPVGGSNYLADVINAKRDLPYEIGTMLPVSPADIATVGIPLASALGATAIGSRLNRAAEYSDVAKMLPKQRGIFAGVSAKTADLAKLDEAKQMQAAGIPDEQIWRETGWTAGFPDKKWRFEIPDNEAKFKLHELPLDAYGSQEANALDALQHPVLKSAYPELNDISMIHYPSEEYRGASFIPQDKTIMLGREAIKDKSVPLHELQHAIQEREGFARGGSPEQFKVNPDVMQGLHTYEDMLQAENLLNMAKKNGIRISEMQNPPRWASDKVIAIARNFENRSPADLKVAKDYVLGANDPMTAYRSLAGEAEARLTQARMKLTPEERLAQYPVSQFDVPVDQQIVRYGSGEARSVPKTGLYKYDQAPVENQAAALEQWAKDNGIDLQLSGASNKSNSLYYTIRKPTEIDPEYGVLDWDTAHIRLGSHYNQTNTDDYLNATKHFNIYPDGDSLGQSADDILDWLKETQ